MYVVRVCVRARVHVSVCVELPHSCICSGGSKILNDDKDQG